MTSRNPVFLVLAIWSLDAVSGASFSNVIVQRGSDVLPLQYINYNPSALTYTSQVARLSQAPLQSVISEPLAASVLSPCVSPCVIPNAGPIHSTPNAKIVTYKTAPSVPVILPKDEARGYQYAYAVFDEHTGDKKTQSEHSDGSVVQGHYSFIQPDGFVREVVYTADDLKGFNAVVRNISPGPEHKHPAEAEKEHQEKKPSVPCTSPKNEHLTQHESHKEIIHVIPEHLEVEYLEEKKNTEATAEKVNEHEHTEENSIEKSEEKPEGHAHEDKSLEDKHHENQHHEDQHHEDHHHEDQHHENPHHEDHHHEDQHHENPHHEDQHHEDQHHEDKDHEDKSHENIPHGDEHHEEVLPTVEFEEGHEPNTVISYSDIVKCLQSKLHGSQTAVSPLTYVLLPSAYKPC